MQDSSLISPLGYFFHISQVTHRISHVMHNTGYFSCMFMPYSTAMELLAEDHIKNKNC